MPATPEGTDTLDAKLFARCRRAELELVQKTARLTRSTVSEVVRLLVVSECQRIVAEHDRHNG